MLPSLTPPPPLTPKRIPPMRQLSSPLKNVSRYLDQEGQSSDEDSDCEDITRNNREKQCEIRKNPCNERNKVTEKEDANKRCSGKRPLSPSYEEDGLSITTAAENRNEETPSPPRSIRSKQKSQEKDEDELIVIDDRDAVHSKTGSLLLVKRRKMANEFIPKKSPVVSLLFTRTGKDAARTRNSPQPVGQAKGPSPTKKRSSPFIYSRKRGTAISPITAQDAPRPRDRASPENVSRDSVSRNSMSRDSVSCNSVSRDKMSRNHVSRNSLPRNQCQSPDLERTKLKVVTNSKERKESEQKICPGSATTKLLSFVATRLNRKQLVSITCSRQLCSPAIVWETGLQT